MNYFKSGCNWGSGKPDNYCLLKKHSIVICANHDIRMGDFVAIAQGFSIVAIAQVKSKRYPCTENPKLEKDFKEYKIDYENWNCVADAIIWELPKNDKIWYEQQKGICKIHQPNIQNKISAAINKIMGNKMVENCKKILLGNHNLILTGAPGTGKTFLAKKIAKELGATEENHQCKMVQFHPSYDYTDFVEGLRPKDNQNDGSIGFELRRGSFKEFCVQALENLINSKKSSKDIGEDAMFQAAYDEMIDKVRNVELTEIPLKSNNMSMEIVGVSDNNNLILKAKGSDAVKYIISHRRLRKLSLVYKDKNSLDSISNIDKAVREAIKGCNTSAYWATLYFLYKNYLRQNTIEAKTVERKNFVFIIDEINRGEISKIFGELFFSIDPGYRGESGTVQTQYQNMIEEGDIYENGFYVPENVYVIGTMNDIDRSVESMDFAMRRRFAWKEITVESRQSMLDDESAWDGKKPGQGVIDEIKARMNNLNACIIDKYGTEELSPKDKIGLTKAYQIGASYFLKLCMYENNFDELWANHIEGLLYEYLRGTSNIEAKIERLKTAYNDTIAH